VWVNYLTNAIKYGGEPPRLLISADVVDDGFVRYAVRDNGPGIPPERLGLLFTASQQTRRRNSHGFGLSIVRQIVEKLGGRVGVASELDTGSTFWFELPAASAGEPAS
jgi:signal transduction histidine kinase